KTLLILAIAIVIRQVMANPTTGKVIYGNDDRQDYYEVLDQNLRNAADSTVALIRAANLSQNGAVTNISTVSYGQGMGLCANEPFYNQETAAFCSGFLVGPDMVVTAGHCISDQASCINTKMVFGFKLSAKDVLPRAVPTDHVYSCLQVIHSVSVPTGEDFAVVKLDRPVTQFVPLAYRTTGKINVGDALHVIGHPAGLPLKVAGGGHVRTVQAQFLVANLDTYGGNSGSAVFNSVTGEVEGVLVRGETDYVFQNGCRSSNRCPDTGCRGEDVTLFERVLPYLPH
ncbi:MAG: trypsin-like serine peptidase, partial [Bdellovibrionales bacterium]